MLLVRIRHRQHRVDLGSPSNIPCRPSLQHFECLDYSFVGHISFSAKNVRKTEAADDSSPCLELKTFFIFSYDATEREYEITCKFVQLGVKRDTERERVIVKQIKVSVECTKEH